MSVAWSPLLISALLGGVLGGAVARAWPSGDATNAAALRPTPPRTLAAAAAPRESAATDESGNDTQERMRRLEHRIALLAAAVQGAGLKSHDAGQELPSGDPTDVADPVFEAAVLDIVDRDNERKKSEGKAWRKRLQTESSKRYASELTESLQLAQGQQEQVAEVVADYFERLAALRDEDAPSRPVTRLEWRAAHERIHQSIDEKLRNILSPAQLASYEALEPEQKLGFGRRPRQRATMDND